MSKEFSVGDKVQLATPPPYLKTAEPMPMLRPPHLVKVGEEGTVTALNPGGSWSVRFANGTFLIDSQYIEPVEPAPVDDAAQHVDNPSTLEETDAG